MFLSNLIEITGLKKKTSSKFNFFKNIQIGDNIEIKMNLNFFGSRGGISTPFLSIKNLRTNETHSDHGRKVLNRLDFCETKQLT